MLLVRFGLGHYLKLLKGGHFVVEGRGIISKGTIFRVLKKSFEGVI